MNRLTRRSFCILMILLAGVSSRPASAAPQLLFDGLPASFTPGQTLTFDVLLIGADDLAAFDLTLTVTADAGTAGTDYVFTAATEPIDRYVFTGGDLGGFIADADGSEVSVSDFLMSGTVDTAADINDRLATVTVLTTAAAGNLTVSILAEQLFLDDEAGQPIAGLDQLLGDLPSATIYIPEPAAASLVLAGLLALSRPRHRPSTRFTTFAVQRPHNCQVRDSVPIR